ncbi:hypothetical protein GCK32_010925 [Trichostrongylus colubriformis]|uniref:Uncharacterized protein n=1 Tax=Trichostrongylus colubriformis TaxID=6319 RepID=A0AAN8FJ18_TRICO
MGLEVAWSTLLEERLGVEVYMTPQYRSFKNGSVQFTEIINGLNSAGIKINSIWIQKYRIGLGFYTNFYEWSQITNDAWVNGSQLWYWNVRGGGSRGETLPDFSDFRPFGKWTKAIVKQFAQVENICGVTLNRDVYSVNGVKQVLKATEQKAENPVVGATFGNIAFEGFLQNK